MSKRPDGPYVYDDSSNKRSRTDEERLLFSDTPETIRPSISKFFSNININDYISIDTAIISLKNVYDKIGSFIKTTENQIIEETNTRRQLKEQKVAQQMIDKALTQLKIVSDKSKVVRINAVLDMVQRETLAELVIDDVMPESVEEIPGLLVVPILDIVCHYEEYFKYTEIESKSNDDINQNDSLKINNAYSEFRNKQKIRDMLNQLYEKKDVTLNDVIDDLFTLYNSNFSLPDHANKKLSVNGRVRVMKSLYTKSPDTVILENAEENSTKSSLPVISAINYSAIWDKHAKNRADVDRDLALLRNPIDASQYNTPQPTAVRTGHNTRYYDITDEATAKFAEPMVRVNIDPETPRHDSSSQVSDFEASSQDSISGVSQDTAHKGANYLMKYMLLRDSGFTLNDDIDEYAKAVVDEMKAAAKEKMTKKRGEMADIARQKNELADERTTKLIKLAVSLKDNHDDDAKTRQWDSGVHRIFLEWYRENELLEKDRNALDQDVKTSDTSTSVFGSMFNNVFKNIGEGGKKSHKHHKPHKKHTRKNKKRSTRKKNIKKRAGNTKKQ